MARKMWVYDPQSGGRAISDAVKLCTRRRILEHAHRKITRGNTPESMYGSAASSAISMRTRSPSFRQTTTQHSTENHGKIALSNYAQFPSIFAGCGTSEMKTEAMFRIGLATTACSH